MRTSSNCLSRKKHDAMHWRPGIVSHSLAEAPTSWKYCCAYFKCSALSVVWPRTAWTTPFRMYSYSTAVIGVQQAHCLVHLENDLYNHTNQCLQDILIQIIPTVVIRLKGENHWSTGMRPAILFANVSLGNPESHSVSFCEDTFASSLYFIVYHWVWVLQERDRMQWQKQVNVTIPPPFGAFHCGGQKEGHHRKARTVGEWKTRTGLKVYIWWERNTMTCKCRKRESRIK